MFSHTFTEHLALPSQASPFLMLLWSISKLIPSCVLGFLKCDFGLIPISFFLLNSCVDLMSSFYRSGLEVCGWLGIHRVGSKDLRYMDREIHFVTGVGMSEGRGGSSETGSGQH